MHYDDDDELIAPKIRVTAGQLLREARLNHELSIEAVADELRLAPQLIADLENDTPDPRYKTTFVRGYLRAYARFVGISPALVLECYESHQSMLAPEDKISLSRAVVPPRRNQDIHSNFAQWLMGLKETVLTLRPPVVGAITVSILALVLLGTESKETMVLHQSPTPQGQRVAQIAQRVDGEFGNDNIVAITDTAKRAKKLLSDNTVVLKVEFKDTCWVSVFDANHARLATGIRDAKTPLVIEGKPPLRVMLGNPKVASVTFNGELVDLDIPVKDEMVNLTLG